MINSIKSYLLLVLSSLLLLAGCGSKVGPGPTSGFIGTNFESTAPELPFHKVWEKPGLNFRNYRELYVAPINTDYLRTMSWWQEFGKKDTFETDIIVLAEYTKYRLKQAFRDDPYYYFNVVEYPSDQAIIFEMALTEVVPNKAVMEAMSFAGGPIGGGIGLITGGLFRGASQSTVAFEARIRDSATNEIIAMYADREAEKSSVINFKSFSWYGHAYEIIEDWADQFVKILNREPGQEIPDSKPFTLKMW